MTPALKGADLRMVGVFANPTTITATAREIRALTDSGLACVEYPAGVLQHPTPEVCEALAALRKKRR